MKKIMISVLMFSTFTMAQAANFYGTALCGYPQFECIKVTNGQSWESLFPDETQRDLVQRINRTYNHLWSGKEIAVPKNLASLTLLDVSLFP